MNALITSAAYVNPEMAAEFGLLPPAFLPLGTQRLYELQAQALAQADRIHLSLPEGFQIGPEDQRLLDSLLITVISVPEGLSLGGSIEFCLNRMDVDGALAILHGDTLMSRPAAFDLDHFSVGSARDGYRWAVASVDQGDRIVSVADDVAAPDVLSTSILEGFFTVSDARLLRSALADASGDFIQALDRYCREKVVRTERRLAWHDFGHLQTYFQARQTFASARAFNNLTIEDRVVTKFSRNDVKLEHEALWLDSVPWALKPYTARLLDHGPELGGYAYRTQYEFLPTLAELHVFGRLTANNWAAILHACAAFLDRCSEASDPLAPNDALVVLGRDKTLSRLAEYSRLAGVDLDRSFVLNGWTSPSLRQITDELVEIIALDDAPAASVMHGDFCFSNIMFDARSNSIRAIDPRGSIDGVTPSLLGDTRYDAAKFLHSAIGHYDLIISGRCRFSTDARDPYVVELAFSPQADDNALQALALAMSAGGVAFDRPSVLATMILLFLSMPPLHFEKPERAAAFIANAIRLYRNHFASRP